MAGAYNENSSRKSIRENTRKRLNKVKEDTKKGAVAGEPEQRRKTVKEQNLDKSAREKEASLLKKFLIVEYQEVFIFVLQQFI